ncbi:MAG: ABC transporter substrate-binding protein [Candidatus Caldarchaeum sp.]|nr:ABC transporter substrate-binding protein [Candidatus Caldarchaeum sp.]MDW8359993.1 ABC transporter substrate-binding protein [Candidatus Caldarchaeum sp.]
MNTSGALSRSAAVLVALLVVVGAFGAVGWVREPATVTQFRTTTVGAGVAETRTVTQFATTVSVSTVVSVRTVTTTPPPPTPIKMRLASIAFPSYMMFLQLIVQEKRFDLKHGLDITWVPQPTIAGFYATINTGEADGIPGGGPLVFQRMYLEGSKLVITNTLVPMSAVYIVSLRPDINSIRDLVGKKLAIDVGAAEFMILRTYGRSVGIDIERDITIVPSAYPVARGRLLTGEVDAAVLVEPHIALARAERPALRVVANLNDLWTSLTGQPFAVYLVSALSEQFVRNNPDAPRRFIAMLQEVEDFIARNPAEADRILAKGMNIPEGVMLYGILSESVRFKSNPAWTDQTRPVIEKMFEVAKTAGIIADVPGPGIIYRP